MKKFVLSVAILLIGIFAVQADNTAYYPDFNSVDQLFAQAEQVDPMAMPGFAPLAGMETPTTILSDKDPAIAFILAWFLGPLGIHRAYLGTSTGTIVAYIITLGGCGIVAFVDWVMLLIGLVNDDISKYVDNPSFFMW